MVSGFDFGFTTDGEIIINKDTHDIYASSGNELRIQLSYNRIKSIARDWFVDEVGANLEEIIGKPCTEDIAEVGKTKIYNVLTFDDLWSEDDLFIKAEIKNNICIIYTIYLKIYQNNREDAYSYEITAELDLIKGVKVRYGWIPRRGAKWLS